MNSNVFTIIILLVVVLISNIFNIDAVNTTTPSVSQFCNPSSTFLCRGSGVLPEGTSWYISGTSSLLINCGLFQPTQSIDGLEWQTDDDPSFAPPNLDAVSTVFQNEDPTGELPYQVGRVFWSNITYTFSITPGPVFIRLYFFPNVSYNDILPHQFSTSVFANGFTLFKNFNPFLNSGVDHFYEFQLILEYPIDAIGIPIPLDNLNLTFSPSSNAASSNISYGYVNGIEIESVPWGLYIDQTNLSYRYVPDKKKGYLLDKYSAAFQVAFRLNVGGEYVSKVKDNPGGMRRTWEADDAYLVGPQGLKFQPIPGTDDVAVDYTKKTPPYVAPKVVYETLRTMGDDPAAINLGRNLTWVFQVDPGFDYVVRLHMRETNLNVIGIGQRSMCVYIGGYVADPGIDIWAEAGGFGVPIYKDYVTTVLGTSNGSKVPLSLALHPNLAFITDVTLNGVEILKLSSSHRNLAVPNQMISNHPTPRNQSSTRNTTTRHRSSTHKITPAIVGGVIGCVLLVIILLVSLLRRRLQSLLMTTRTNLPRRPSIPLDLCRRFSLSQIKVATHEFDPKSVIGRGGFGKVYKGCIDDNEGATNVAIKRLNSTSNQGEHEFLTEIKMLSRLRHKHLVSLIGYCDDKGEMILVYEYMPRGTLRDHLKYRDSKRNNNNDDQFLSWKQRLAICLGAARGLEYLHAGTQQLIIHRDVKSTNILLDENWTAKVSDFGLSKVGPASDTGGGHVSTTVKGSFGYLDPEYYQRGQLTEKSDVYSFGVMLFEVLCAQPAVGLNLPKVRACCSKGTLDTIVDPTLTGQITPECLSKYGEIAEMCVRGNRDERPSMRDVVWSLEYMLALQQTAENTSDNVSPMVEITIRSNAGYDNEDGESTPFQSRVDEVDAQEGSATIDNTHMDVKSSSVFSDLQAR